MAVARKAAAASTAVAVVDTLSPAELMNALQQSGMVQPPSTTRRRMRLDGGVLVTLDANGEVEDMYPPKVVKGVPQPACTLRIVEPPVYYNVFWLGAPKPGEQDRNGTFDASLIGHPEWNGRFVKKYDDPAEQANDQYADLPAYEAVAAASGTRGRFVADLQVQVVPETGEMTGEETIYTLTLSTSSALDWRGTRKAPEAGVAQEKNFIVQLGEFAVAKAIEAGASSKEELQLAVLNAMTALRLGGVVADVYLLRQSNQDNSITWTVIAFKPVHIEMPEANAVLSSGAPAEDADNLDDIPF